MNTSCAKDDNGMTHQRVIMLYLMTFQGTEVLCDTWIRGVEGARSIGRYEEIEKVVELAVIDVDLGHELSAPVFNLELLLGLFGGVNDVEPLSRARAGVATHT